MRLASAALVALLLASGCHSSQKRQTAAEWLKENTLILDQLKSYEHKERHEGIRRFMKLGKERGMEVTTFLLDDPKLDDYRIEVVLARILSEWHDRRAIPYLLRNLRSRDEGAVEIAREGLTIFGDDPQILAAVSELASDAELSTRKVAVAVLSEMRAPEAGQVLAERMKVEEDNEVRGICLVGILHSVTPEKTRLLLEVLSDPDPDIRRLAWDAIEKKNPPIHFDPDGDPASRAQAVADLRRWAGVRTLPKTTADSRGAAGARGGPRR